MGILIGIDGGGTKTICVVQDESGQIIGRAESGPANYLKVGVFAAKKALRTAIKRAVDRAGVSREKVAALCAGIAGVYRDRDREIMSRVFREILPVQHLVLESDAYITLVGATNGKPGVIVIAGTGSIAFGVNSSGLTTRSGGWGYLLGDEGSGYDMARKGLIASLRDHDGRGEKTVLREILVRELYLGSIEEVIPLIYGGELGQRNLASLYPLVLEAAEAGDGVANRIIQESGDELAKAAAAVIEELNEPNTVLPVALWGGAFQNSSRLRQSFEEALKARTQKARLIEPENPPEVGALIVAQAAVKGTKLFSLPVG
jgi:N-acetylglucosamine kinase